MKPTTTKAPAKTTTEAAEEEEESIPWGTIAWSILGAFLLGLLVLWCYMTCKDYSKEGRGEDEQVLLEMA